MTGTGKLIVCTIYLTDSRDAPLIHEGVAFKHTNAPYIAGRPASGSMRLKHKFCETASIIVGKINANPSPSRSAQKHDGSE